MTPQSSHIRSNDSYLSSIIFIYCLLGTNVGLQQRCWGANLGAARGCLGGHGGLIGALLGDA